MTGMLWTGGELMWARMSDLLSKCFQPIHFSESIGLSLLRVLDCVFFFSLEGDQRLEWAGKKGYCNLMLVWAAPVLAAYLSLSTRLSTAGCARLHLTNPRYPYETKHRLISLLKPCGFRLNFTESCSTLELGDCRSLFSHPFDLGRVVGKLQTFKGVELL